MARTVNGRCTGRAAQIERAEQAEEFRKSAFSWRWGVAIKELLRLDPEGFAPWYDARPEQTCGEMLPLIEERISFLHNSIIQQENESVITL